MILVPLEPEVRNRTRSNCDANFGFAAPAGYSPILPTAAKPDGHNASRVVISLTIPPPAR
jgi:hypothetical protein